MPKIIDCNALIVGAGPAGIISAYTISKTGYHVILADKKTKNDIGKKVCGDAVSKKVTTFLKDTLSIEPPHGNELNNIAHDIILKADAIEEKIPKEVQLVDRYRYSQRLIEEIKQYDNTEVLSNLRAKKVITENGRIAGVEFLDKSSNCMIIKAKVTIDCSGVNYILRKSLSRENYPPIDTVKLKPHNTAICYREIIQLKTDYKPADSLQIIYSKDIPLPGYFWIFPKKVNLLNVGITYPLNKKSDLNCSIKELYQKNLFNHLKEKYHVIHGQGATYPIKFPLLNAVNDNFLVAGDAAFHIDPLFGEGYGPALLAGYFAGSHAVNALKSNKFSSDALWGYNIDILNNFGQKFLTNFLIESILQKMNFQTFKNTLPLLMHRFKTTSVKKVHPQEKSKSSTLEGTKQMLQEVTDILKDYPQTPDEYSSWNKKLRYLLSKVLYQTKKQ